MPAGPPEPRNVENPNPMAIDETIPGGDRQDLLDL
jgi:hypothetical protein